MKPSRVRSTLQCTADSRTSPGMLTPHWRLCPTVIASPTSIRRPRSGPDMNSSEALPTIEVGGSEAALPGGRSLPEGMFPEGMLPEGMLPEGGDGARLVYSDDILLGGNEGALPGGSDAPEVGPGT